jgi:hypothetical protein
VTTLALYALLTTAAYYLLAKAMITRWLWSKYPAWLDYYTSCAACSGFLYGVVVALVLGWPLKLTFLGLDGRAWFAPVLVGLGSMVWTPIIANMQIHSLINLGVPDPSSDPAQSDPTTHVDA